MKKCNKINCQNPNKDILGFLSLDQFNKNKNTKDGYYRECKLCWNKYITAKRDTNRTKYRLQRKIYKLNNRAKYNLYESNRRALKHKAIPNWLTEYHKEQIKQFYINCPEGHHVDHIVPLKAVDPNTKIHIACGLHVPWNLQYLTSSENHKKSNRLVGIY